MERKTGFNLGYLLVAVLAMLTLRDCMQQWQAVEAVPYSRFEQYLADGRFESVEVGDTRITGTLKVAEPGGKRVIVATLVEPALAERLAPSGVTYTRVHTPTWPGALLSWVVPALVFFGIWYFLVRRMADKFGGGLGGGLMGIGKSRVKVYVERRTGVTFDDVAGVDEAKAELQEIVEFLKNPKEYGRLGARVPKGVLLVGPTGTGKTLLARAVAGEAQVAFFSISGSEFIELFVGVGAARVRDLFEQARAHAPAIIFIDELDALGKARGAFPGIGGHDEREQTLNQLLVEMDGFDPSVGVVLLAATNRPEILDPALLRAGRFDRQVLVDRPDRIGRAAILRVHAKKIVLAPDVDLDQVAGLTVGLAGADLANIVNEAALVATRRKGERVTLADFTAAIERVLAGIEKKTRVFSPREREVVAHHEAGHALVALALPGSDQVHKISIVPRGIGALGYTMQRPSEDRHLVRAGELASRIAVLLGGRAAEQLVFGELSTGAADDIARATAIARDMVVRYGMDEGLGHVSYGDATPRLLETPGLPTWSQAGIAPRTAERIDAAVQRIVQEGFDTALRLLDEHRALLLRVAQALLARETLEEAELAAIVGNELAPARPPAAPAPATRAAPAVAPDQAGRAPSAV
ncbi:MAG: ATP-dependent zinc metalloprotease FtsH [Rubrivivax sp.]|nr:ATP-dependent zinc metalloprotease FtsH [Rubrivivax sp.]